MIFFLMFLHFNVITESRQIYLEEILDWTDNYTENLLSNSSSQESKDALSSIVKLWIAFCTMEITLRQFKRAVKLFEDAISDPIASRSANTYLAYVDYCSTRGKFANAQKVYIKGLSSELGQEEADKLWVSFLSFIQSQGSPDLNLEQLYEAVKSEAAEGTILSSFTTGLSSVVKEEKVSEVEPIVKVKQEKLTDAESKADEENTISMEIVDEVVIAVKVEDVFGTGEEIISEESVDKDKMDVIIEETQEICEVTEKNVLDNKTNPVAAVSKVNVAPGGVGDDLDSVVGLTPDQLIRMYRHRPPMLFSAPAKEPTVLELSSLSTEEVLELESFLGVSLSTIKYGERQGPADAYLNLVEGLWTAQALKERHFDSWFTDLKKLHEKEVL
jgi:hypothetical protein